MALRRALGLNYSVILNPRLICSKLQPSPSIYKNVSPKLGILAPLSHKFSTKPCYDNDGVVTFTCLKNLLDESDIQLIDVRTREEVQRGKIPEAANIPLDEIQEAFSLSPEEFKTKYSMAKPRMEDENITIHCKTGKRAQDAIHVLQGLGYTRVHNYTGGWVEWQKAMEEDTAAAMLAAAEVATAASTNVH